MNTYKDGDTRPCMNIALVGATNDIFASKVGGVGYIPHDDNFPVDNKGNQLRFLAQVNCSEITLAEFPKSGLLQFWILNNDYGLYFDDQTNQNTFRVIYYERVDRTVTREAVMSKYLKNEYDDEEDIPVSGEIAIKLTEGTSTFYDFSDDKYEDMEADPDDYAGHKIGGFPAFTQSDPREYDEKLEKYDYLLFQLDTDSCGDGEIMWGDCGIGNFFIPTEKLKKCDFSDVMYNWDCC